MAWRRDPATGEWEMVDSMTPDPMTQGMTGQEEDPSLRDLPSARPPSTERGYSDPALGFMPLPVQEEPSLDYAASPDNADGYTDPDLGTIPLSPADARPYQNEDYAIIDRWVREVQARGNEVRQTAVGTFEVEAGTNNIVSPMPSPYRVN